MPSQASIIGKTLYDIASEFETPNPIVTWDFAAAAWEAGISPDLNEDALEEALWSFAETRKWEDFDWRAEQEHEFYAGRKKSPWWKDRLHKARGRIGKLWRAGAEDAEERFYDDQADQWVAWAEREQERY